jgi:hypothetical protein
MYATDFEFEKNAKGRMNTRIHDAKREVSRAQYVLFNARFGPSSRSVPNAMRGLMWADSRMLRVKSWFWGVVPRDDVYHHLQPSTFLVRYSPRNPASLVLAYARVMQGQTFHRKLLIHNSPKGYYLADQKPDYIYHATLPRSCKEALLVGTQAEGTDVFRFFQSSLFDASLMAEVFSFLEGPMVYHNTVGECVETFARMASLAPAPPRSDFVYADGLGDEEQRGPAFQAESMYDTPANVFARPAIGHHQHPSSSSSASSSSSSSSLRRLPTHLSTKSAVAARQAMEKNRRDRERQEQGRKLSAREAEEEASRRQQWRQGVFGRSRERFNDDDEEDVAPPSVNRRYDEDDEDIAGPPSVCRHANDEDDDSEFVLDDEDVHGPGQYVI